MQYDISFIKDVIISDEKYERSFNEHIGLFSIDCINKNKNLLFDNNESKPRIASNISLKKILFIKNSKYDAEISRFGQPVNDGTNC